MFFYHFYCNFFYCNFIAGFWTITTFSAIMICFISLFADLNRDVTNIKYNVMD